MKNNESTISGYMIFACCTAFYAFQYVLRVIPNVTMSEIMNRFDIDALGFGQFAGLYYMGYIAAHIPLGIMLDKFNTKVVIGGSILIALLGTLPLVCCESITMALGGRVLVGVGSSCAVLGVFKIVSAFFEKERFSGFLGIAVTIGLLGAIYGGKPVSGLLDLYGFDVVIYGMLSMGFALFLAVMFLVPDVKEMCKSDSGEGESKSSIFNVVLDPRFIILSLSAGMMIGPLEGFADAWGVGFLQTVYGFSKGDAAGACSLIFFGMCAGCAIIGITSIKGGYLKVVFIQGITMLITFSCILAFHKSLSMTMINTLCFITGLACSYQVLTVSQVSQYFTANIGIATSSNNTVAMSFGYLFHTCISFVVEKFADHSKSGIESYGFESYIYGVGVIPIATAIGICGIVALMRMEK